MTSDLLSSLIDFGVLGLLAVLSIVAVAIALERSWCYRGLDLQRHADRASLELLLSERLVVIASVASNAPYLGLLGTVFGIMLTFQQIGQAGAIDPLQVMTGLAMALKATAAGLVVALIAVALHNGLTRRAQVLMLRWAVAHPTAPGAAQITAV